VKRATSFLIRTGRRCAHWLLLGAGGIALVNYCDAQTELAMTFPAQEWEETTPESQGMDSEKLREAIEFLRNESGRDGVRELVIARHGRLVWRGDNIDHRHGVWSCTKSFTSTVLGILVADGKCSLDDPAARYVPELTARYPAVTLRHLVTMTSGYKALGDEPVGSYAHGPSPTPFAPGPEPLFAPAGSQYAYWDSAMNLLALALTRIAEKPIEDLFRERIAEPLGMGNWDWGDYARRDGIVVNGGAGNGNRHVFITARELARFGHLFLNQGLWDGRQLLSREWVKTATSVQVPSTHPWAHPASGIDGRGCYGFNWWVNGIKADGERLWPGAPPGMFAASGHNNNKCCVIPEWAMVIVRLGLDQNDRKISDATWGIFIAMVHDALGQTPGVPESGD
jgi:CubicO group peptidase (beta-lactamase class C family)